jgi:hypothetical protein
VRSLLAATALTALALATAATAADGVSVQQSPTTPPTPGAAYAWAPPEPAARGLSDPRLANEVTQERLHRAIDRTLKSKGYRPVADPGAAQLLVKYYVALKDHAPRPGNWGSTRMLCGPYGCRPWQNTTGDREPEPEAAFTEGKVVLELIDRASGTLAWRATSKRRLDERAGTQAGMNAIFDELAQSLPRTAAN